jgi:hypothetical protein
MHTFIVRVFEGAPGDGGRLRGTLADTATGMTAPFRDAEGLVAALMRPAGTAGAGAAPGGTETGEQA